MQRQRCSVWVAGLSVALVCLSCSPSTQAPRLPDDAPILRVFPYQLRLEGALDIVVECRVDGAQCVPANLDPALGCRERLEVCATRWESVTTWLPAPGDVASAIPLRTEDELESPREIWRFRDVKPTHLGVGVENAVQARMFLSVPHTLSVMDGVVGMVMTQSAYHPNGLKLFYIHLDRREMPLAAGQMWLDRPHVALRPDGFRVWTAGSKEPVWIPRAEPLDGWRELIAATRALDRRGYDADTLVVAVHPEVRFWALWRTLALVGLRYATGAFDGAEDLDTVRPVLDGDEPERRFRRVWLTIDDS